MTTPDFRALVRVRMTALGITQAALARRMVPRWGCVEASAVKRLSRWFNQTRDGEMTSEPLAELLAELGGTVAWDASESSGDETEGAPESLMVSGLTCREPT